MFFPPIPLQCHSWFLATNIPRSKRKSARVTLMTTKNPFRSLSSVVRHQVTREIGLHDLCVVGAELFYHKIYKKQLVKRETFMAPPFPVLAGHKQRSTRSAEEGHAN